VSRWAGGGTVTAVIGGWVLVAGASTVLIQHSGALDQAPLAPALLFRLQLLNSLPWVGAILAALFLAGRWPVRRDDLVRPLTLHLAAGLGIVATMGVGLAALRTLWAPPGLYPSSAFEGARVELAQWGHLALALYLVLVALALFVRSPEGPARE
jgi:hypothetical protein